MNIGLTFLNGDMKGAVCEIAERQACLIGRDASCQICLHDKAVSKTHATISFLNGNLLVEDLSSHNGTFVNGKRITQQELHEGDTITIGISVLMVTELAGNTSTSMTSSVFSNKQAIDFPAPVHKPYLGHNSPKLAECTKQIQIILNKHADSSVKESLKVLFKILPVTRLSIFKVDEHNKVSQGYTVMRKAGDRTAQMSQSFAQKILTEGEAILVEDTSDMDSSDRNTSTGFMQVRSIMGVPITIQGKNRAILLGDNLEQPHIFTDEHLRIMRFAGKVIEVLYQLDAVYKLDNIGNFLPICTSCKKIRDDQGYWNQLESFISERTAVRFSHGYCPQCAEKFLSEFNAGNSGK